MITDNELYDQLREATPDLFAPSVRASKRALLDIWPLPSDRVLFSMEDRGWAWGNADAAKTYLFVLDRHERRVSSAGNPTGYADRYSAVVGAIEWMQGLRHEDRSGIDPAVLDWLGEMAWRIGRDGLKLIEREYRAFGPEAWGHPDDPEPGPGEYLAAILTDMRFSDDYLARHLG